MKKRFISILLVLCMTLTLLPTIALAAKETLVDGWYNLRCMNNYLNLTSDGKAELRQLSVNEAFYAEHTSDNQITLKMQDGRYLGLEGDRKNGERVVAVSKPYTWVLIWEKKSEIFSLRPPEYIPKVVNASGQKNADGTPIIIWTHEGSHGGSYGGFNAPEHAEFRFIPVTKLNDPTGESWRTFKENGLTGYKDFQGNVVIPAQFSHANEFSQGVARVNHPDKSGCAFIDTTGKPITPYKYAQGGTGRTVCDGLIRVSAYSDAVTKALLAGDKIDRSVYENGKGTMYMKSGKIFTGKDVGTKHGYINTKGQEVIKPQFDTARDFHNGLAAVYQLQGTVKGREYYKVGWINTSGKLVIPYQSEEYSWFAGKVHDFDGDFVCYFKQGSQGLDYMPMGGIMDKTGKVIIPAEKNTFMDAAGFGLYWKDGVIAVAPWCKANEKGRRDAGGKYWWPHLYLYDYTGRLIAKPEGYTNGYPLGGGYTLSMYQTPVNETVEGLGGKEYPAYWSVFDRYGKKVVEKAEPNNFYLLNAPYGYENGYVFFGETRVKVKDVPIVPARHPFTDVAADSYYEEAVIWAKNTGVTGGTTATTFSPNAACTRAQVVTFLWRASGSPAPSSTNNPFTDVKPTDYYYKAVLWAVEQGITGGTDATTFSPNATCTGGQVITFLWRANGSPVIDPYIPDATFYTKAVAWAAEKGLLSNTGSFSAEGPSPRAAIVTFLHRNAK